MQYKNVETRRFVLNMAIFIMERNLIGTDFDHVIVNHLPSVKTMNMTEV